MGCWVENNPSFFEAIGIPRLDVLRTRCNLLITVGGSCHCLIEIRKVLHYAQPARNDYAFPCASSPSPRLPPPGGARRPAGTCKSPNGSPSVRRAEGLSIPRRCQASPSCPIEPAPVASNRRSITPQGASCRATQEESRGSARSLASSSATLCHLGVAIGAEPGQEIDAHPGPDADGLTALGAARDDARSTPPRCRRAPVARGRCGRPGWAPVALSVSSIASQSASRRATREESLGSARSLACPARRSAWPAGSTRPAAPRPTRAGAVRGRAPDRRSPRPRAATAGTAEFTARPALIDSKIVAIGPPQLR